MTEQKPDKEMQKKELANQEKEKEEIAKETKEEKVEKTEAATKKGEKKEKQIVEKTKDIVVSNAEAKKLQKLIKEKDKPKFYGRFGKRNWIRSVKDEKWQRWRKPRGIDAKRAKKGFTEMPSIGFRTPKKIRYLHPSGYKEVIIRNAKELKEIAEKIKESKENIAVKIHHAVGLKKRNEIISVANELKIKVLN